MAGMGPPPNPNRRRRNATVAMTKLPAGGRQDPPPDWPLPPDVRAETLLRMLNDQIDAAALDAQGTGRAARAAERKLLGLRERAEVLAAEIEAAAEQEAALWRELWATPQAVAWERLRWTREVAQYVRWKVRAEQGDLDAAKEARQLADRLGLNPLALLRLRWEITTDEVGERRHDQAQTKSSAGSAAARRRGLKAVDGGATGS
ncbi:MAG TPA: hypothetical protein VGX25_04075 [Actinophytocola sp.]|uniref:hypothetical protein n=1 Tax=Actinophytocola sp. TaxID=1872138 RepID=UPI002DDD67AD|nr:hypothetical protein [Actinophytocola sp.]HEV2778556.1 hypothetical protein [Actinophytocola sp.]